MSNEIRTPPDLETDTLLKEFLGLGKDEHYKFLLPVGESVAILQRVRVTLSRKRKIARLQGIRIKEFRLKSEVRPIDYQFGGDNLDASHLNAMQNGTDYEVVDVWRHRTTTGKLTEIFEDLKRN